MVLASPSVSEAFFSLEFLVMRDLVSTESWSSLESHKTYFFPPKACRFLSAYNVCELGNGLWLRCRRLCVCAFRGLVIVYIGRKSYNLTIHTDTFQVGENVP